MFKKCMRDERDQKGLEPKALFNLVRFMMFDQNKLGEINAEDTYELLYVRWKINDEFFCEKRRSFREQNIEIKDMPYVVSFDNQIFELFSFKPDLNQPVLTDPDLVVCLTFFQYLDKINDLALQHRLKKKKKTMENFGSFKDF